MIEVSVTIPNKGEVACIKIERVRLNDDGTADYAVHFAVDRAKDHIGVHRRVVSDFPRLKYNALALLLQALQTLDPSELELESGTGPSDLARRFGRAWRSLPRQA